MNLLYIANIRLPTDKAHGAQILKTCEALGRLGATVELLVPTRLNSLSGNIFKYYGVEPTFTITHVRVPSFMVTWGRFGYLLQSLLFAFAAVPVVRHRRVSVIYSRDEMVLAFTKLFSKSQSQFVWESHMGAWNFFARWLARHARLVVISRGLQDFYIKKGVPMSNILVAHDGVDLQDFATHESQQEARKRLGLPLDKKLALYAGRVDGWKGADILCEAAALLPHDTQLVIIGGEPAQVAREQKKYPHVLFLGFKPYRELADNLALADVLVLPNSATHIISTSYTSPLKLFAYMASNVPIVASDLPSIREVLTDEAAYFATPDDPGSFVKAIEQALTDTAHAQTRAKRAGEVVQEYSWSNRAQRILKFLK